MISLQTPGRMVADMLGRDSWLVRRLRPAYEQYLTWSSGGKGIPWTINGVPYRIHPKYRPQLGEFYDSPVAAYLRERVRPGDVCIDVGANVGVYVLQFAHWCAPNGRVIAFEPNPNARNALHEHVRMNRIGHRVDIVPAAVSDHIGQETLHAAEADGMSRLGSPSSALEGKTAEIPVPVVTLDHFCRERSLEPDWLVIDIEGFEMAALAGGRNLIQSRGAKLGIIVEMHPDLWPTAKATRASAEALLCELKRTPIPLTGQADPLRDYGIVALMPGG